MSVVRGDKERRENKEKKAGKEGDKEFTLRGSSFQPSGSP